MTPEEKFISEAADFIVEHGSIGTEMPVVLDDGRAVSDEELAELIMEAFSIAEARLV